jgi:endonuclease-3 related protein
LRGHFGHRHWWPGETPFEVAIGAILTQSVAWSNVEKAIAALKGAGMLSPAGILQADDSQLAALIRPSRYPNAKAAKLKAFVRHLQERYGGEMAAMAVGDPAVLRPELLRIWGVGPETADSILLYALEKPVFVVDAYTRRIFARLGHLAEDTGYAAMQEVFQSALPPDVPLYNDYHAQIVALGNNLCFLRKPFCGQCPLQDTCLYPTGQA